eukprot:scaffold263221_cov21-Prasinocladus_malaysianus.AAC.1
MCQDDGQINAIGIHSRHSKTNARNKAADIIRGSRRSSSSLSLYSLPSGYESRVSSNRLVYMMVTG